MQHVLTPSVVAGRSAVIAGSSPAVAGLAFLPMLRPFEKGVVDFDWHVTESIFDRAAASESVSSKHPHDSGDPHHLHSRTCIIITVIVTKVVAVLDVEDDWRIRRTSLPLRLRRLSLAPVWVSQQLSLIHI